MACSLLLYSLPHAPLVHVMVLVTAAWLLDYGFMLTVHTCSTQGAAPQQLHVIVSRTCSCWLLWYDLSYGFTPPSSLTRTCTHTQVLQQGPAQVASRLTALKQALPEVDISLLVERLPQHFLAGDSAATCAQVSHVTHYAMCRRVNQQQCASCRSVCRCIVGSSSQQQQQGPTHTHGPVHPPPLLPCVLTLVPLLLLLLCLLSRWSARMPHCVMGCLGQTWPPWCRRTRRCCLWSCSQVRGPALGTSNHNAAITSHQLITLFGCPRTCTAVAIRCHRRGCCAYLDTHHDCSSGTGMPTVLVSGQVV